MVLKLVKDLQMNLTAIIVCFLDNLSFKIGFNQSSQIRHDMELYEVDMELRAPLKILA